MMIAVMVAKVVMISPAVISATIVIMTISVNL
jgi:hypothetical protein